jgi:hypothetical protein
MISRLDTVELLRLCTTRGRPQDRRCFLLKPDYRSLGDLGCCMGQAASCELAHKVWCFFIPSFSCLPEPFHSCTRDQLIDWLLVCMPSEVITVWGCRFFFQFSVTAVLRNFAREVLVLQCMQKLAGPPRLDMSLVRPSIKEEALGSTSWLPLELGLHNCLLSWCRELD